MKRDLSNLNSEQFQQPINCIFLSLLCFKNSVFTHHLAAFIKEYPDVCLNISYSDTRKDIIAESIDVAFRIGDLPDSSLKARHLFVLPRKWWHQSNCYAITNLSTILMI
jgi:DNA-binding transcriptional LysR family regulator